VAASAATSASFLVAALWIHPLRDVPIVDDWTYAWSVEHLLRTGELRVAEISAVYPVTQILWGALFARVLGFSLGALRMSTLVLGIAGCCALYGTLRALGCERRWSLLGAMALAVHPVYFSLSFSFMTDVPVTALTLLSIMFAAQAVQRDSPARLWAAMLFAVAAFFVRATAIVVPLAILVVVAWRTRRIVMWVTPVLVGLAAIVAGWLVLRRSFGSLEWESGRIDALRYVFTIPVRQYADWNMRLLWQTSAAFTPLLLAGALAASAWRRVLIATAIAAALSWLLIGLLPLPMPDWETWSLQEIGGGRALIGGRPPTSAWSAQAAPVVIAIGLAALGAMLTALVAAMRSLTRERAMILALGFLSLGVVHALWLYNDRYYLILAPTLACVVGWWAAQVRARIWVAALLLSAMWVLAVDGTRDMLDVNETAARAAADLEAAGVPPWEINAGWALNGWHLWAHPENLKPGWDRRSDVPYVTSSRTTRYAIASHARDGYSVIREVPLPHASWQATDRIYVLERAAP
jgi:hypothetical protein